MTPCVPCGTRDSLMTTMMKGAVANLSQAIGHTPIVKLNKVARDVESDIYVKCEYLNPGGSHKDRMALNMIEDAERNGLKPGGYIVEATSGNTGASLAMISAIRGYKCVFVMPDKMSGEKIAALRAFGARVVVCPTAVEADDPRSYYQTAKRIANDLAPNCFYANQYHNPANPGGQYKSLGPEIWDQCGSDLHVFCAGMGTGGTITGAGGFLKEKNPNIKIVGIDPVGSLYYDFVKSGRITKPFSYKVEGIGEDFFPSTMNLKLLDEIVRVDDKECFLMTRDLVRLEGLNVGGSSGAAVAGAIKYAKASGKKENILIVVCDSAQKYLSKIFNDDWMRENGFLEEDKGIGIVADVIKGQTNLVTATSTEKVRDVIEKLKTKSISQVPVVDRGKLIGIVAEVDLLRHLVTGSGTLDSPVGPLVEGDYATVTPDTKIELLQNVLTDAKLAIVLDQGRVVGIVTKIDLIEFLAKKSIVTS